MEKHTKTESPYKKKYLDHCVDRSFRPFVEPREREFIKELEKHDPNDLVYFYSLAAGIDNSDALNYYLFLRGLIKNYIYYNDENGTEGYECCTLAEAQMNFCLLPREKLKIFIEEPKLIFDLPPRFFKEQA